MAEKEVWVIAMGWFNRNKTSLVFIALGICGHILVGYFWYWFFILSAFMFLLVSGLKDRPTMQVLWLVVWLPVELGLAVVVARFVRAVWFDSKLVYDVVLWSGFAMAVLFVSFVLIYSAVVKI